MSAAALGGFIRISQCPINHLTTYRKLPHFTAKSGRSHNRFYDQRSTKLIETRVDQYTEGTLNIDVIDATTKKRGWEGRGAGWITEKDVHNMEQTVDEVVAAVMNNFPILPSGAH